MSRKVNMETVKFTLDDGSSSGDVFVIAQTIISGTEYFLVSDNDLDDNCYILKNTASSDSAEAVLVEVTDNNEWDAIAKVFDLMLEEDIEKL